MRIGLIAMSGVRVVNPKLARLGVHLPQFVKRGEVIAQLPSLALTTLAGCTPPDVELEYIEVSEMPRKGEELPTDFDLVALSSYTAQAYEMYELADRFRDAGVAVVMGGLHVSQVPEEAKEHADAICIGEGELSWPRIVEDFSRAGKDGLQPYYREEKPGHYDLANSPMPRYDLLLARPYNRITIQTTRGCPIDCEFCAGSKLYGPTYRRKPVAKIMAELRRIEELWGRNAFIELSDDNSFGSKQWAKEFLEALKSVDIRWFTETDVSVADHPELLELLYQTGCRQLLIGFEGISSDVLEGIDQRNWKLKRMGQYKDAIRRIQDAGVTVNGCFIVGNDGDTKDVFENLRDFVIESELLEAQVTLSTPFPGTRLLQRLRDEGRLLYENFWDRCTLFDVVFEPKNMTVEELEDGYAWLMRQIDTDEQYAKRKRHYVNIMKRLQAGEP